MSTQCCRQDFKVNDQVTDTEDNNRQATVTRLHPLKQRNAVEVCYTDSQKKQIFIGQIKCDRLTKN